VLSIHEGEEGIGGPEKGFEVSGGWLREEAIVLLRRFYVQENGKGECYFLWRVEGGERERECSGMLMPRLMGL